jgi:hypothetical protein
MVISCQAWNIYLLTFFISCIIFKRIHHSTIKVSLESSYIISWLGVEIYHIIISHLLCDLLKVVELVGRETRISFKKSLSKKIESNKSIRTHF